MSREIDFALHDGSKGHIVNCPHCGADLRVGHEHIGSDVQCAKCQEVFEAMFPRPEIRSSRNLRSPPRKDAGSLLANALYIAGAIVMLAGVWMTLAALKLLGLAALSYTAGGALGMLGCWFMARVVELLTEIAASLHSD